MRSFVTYTLLASATFASATLERRWEYPDTVPALEKRQEPGTPRYQCHEDCGLLITLGREDGFCDNSEWNERYGRCMVCANTFEIWMYYSNGVTSAAEECGLSPTPSPSGYTVSSTSAPEDPTSTEAPAEASTTSPPDEASTTAAVGETTAAEETTAAGETTTADKTTAVGAEPTKTSASEAPAVTTSASGAVPTTLSTSAQVSQSVSGSDSASATDSSDNESSATFTTPGSLGTVGVTPRPTPSTVVVSGAAKHFGFGAAVGVAALAMLSLY